jgi:LysM repeat protein
LTSVSNTAFLEIITTKFKILLDITNNSREYLLQNGVLAFCDCLPRITRTRGTGLKNLIITYVFAVISLTANQAQAQTLKGSPASVKKQYDLAQSYGFNFIQTASEVAPNVKSGELHKVSPGRHIELHDVSYPYAVSETVLFLDRLSQQYHDACGEKLTVTSLLRPVNNQPANAVALSVHPSGMAVDLRIPEKRKCRSWLEGTLLSLEKERVLDVTRERRPAHYHVAVYAEQYETRVAALEGKVRQPPTDTQAQPMQVVAVSSGSASHQSYVVRKGDSLWEISDRTGVSVAALRTANKLQGSRISIGQTLLIPDAANASVQLAANDVTTHRVNRGETLWTIAHRYGTSVKKLRQVNNTGKFLRVGQVLTIYRG